MKRLNVVVVVPAFPRVADAPGIPAVMDLVDRLVGRHDVTVVALHQPRGRKRYSIGSIPVVPLGLPVGRGAAGRFATLAGGTAALVAGHRRRRIDVIHGLWADEPGAIATIAGRLLRVPTVVSAMGGETIALGDIGYGAALGRGGRWTTAAALRAADVVTAGSGYLADQLTAFRASVRPAIVPLGVDTGTFTPGASSSGEHPVVLFVGSLEPVKDPGAAIRIFATIAAGRHDCRLVVCGAGSLRPVLERLTADLGIAGLVAFRGNVPRRELVDLYRSATVLCVTSRHEAQHVAAIEAAACGLPVVGYAVGALADLGGGAITVKAGDQAALAEAVRMVLDDAEVRARMAAAARAKAVTDYDLALTSATVVGIYERLAGVSWHRGGGFAPSGG